MKTEHKEWAKTHKFHISGVALILVTGIAVLTSSIYGSPTAQRVAYASRKTVVDTAHSLSVTTPSMVSATPTSSAPTSNTQPTTSNKTMATTPAETTPSNTTVSSTAPSSPPATTTTPAGPTLVNTTGCYISFEEPNPTIPNQTETWYYPYTVETYSDGSVVVNPGEIPPTQSPNGDVNVSIGTASTRVPAGLPQCANNTAPVDQPAD